MATKSEWLDDLSVKYPRVAPEEADAHAWVFFDKDKYEIYPFKFPELGDNEARMKVISCPFAYYDFQACQGVWGEYATPFCVGHEAIGRITHIGKNVTNRKIGDLVGVGTFADSCGKCDFCLNGDDNLCDGIPEWDKDVESQRFGGMATAFQCNANHMHLIPEGLDPKTDGSLVASGEVAYRMLNKETTKGQKIAILGVGAIGHLVIQFAAAMGLEITAFTSSESKVELIKSLGAHHVVVNSKENDRFIDYENKFDALINLLPVTDPEMNEKLLQMIKPCGKFIQLGFPGDESGSRMTISFYTLIAKQIEIVGYNNGPSKSIQETLEFAANHKITAFSELYDFEEFPKVLDRVKNGKPLFKCVLLMDEYSAKHNL